MLKKITLSVCLILVLLGGFYYFFIYNSVHEINMNADYVMYDSEGVLSYEADIILGGSPEDKFENREHVNTYTDSGSLVDYYTLTKFKVKAVIKNSTTLTINESDSFEVIEPVGLIQQIDGKKILERASYKPMKKNTNYVIYLKNNGMNGYSIINMSNGAFNMDEIDTSENSIYNSENQKHNELLNTVKSRYSKYFD